jgi:phenylpyruvate tautomerase PptA (4-oxalocrotonate tautomerase family)
VLVMHTLIWTCRLGDQKRRLERKTTDLVPRVIGRAPAPVRIISDDALRSDWAIGGMLEANRGATSTIGETPLSGRCRNRRSP